MTKKRLRSSGVPAQPTPFTAHVGLDLARRPGAAEDRHHQEAGFIETDQVRADAAQFSLPWPSRVKGGRYLGIPQQRVIDGQIADLDDRRGRDIPVKIEYAP